MEEKKPKSDKNQASRLKNWAIFTGIALEMGGTIFGCAWIGKKLDTIYGDPNGTNWFTLGFVIFGVAGSLYIVLQQLKRYND
jgi:F0F1-type ATP synthase assembly protein I